jgi:hypothetical protein
VKFGLQQGIGDRPLLMLGVMLVMMGVILVTNGLIAEMLSRTYHESQSKPIYAIREIRETKESEREIAAVGRR